MAEDYTPEGTGNESHGKGGKGQHCADSCVKFGEVELVEKKACNNAVEEEVIPFYDCT